MEKILRDTAISLLNEMLIVQRTSLSHAEIRLARLQPFSENTNILKEIDEFREMQLRTQNKVNDICNCITWISTLEL